MLIVYCGGGAGSGSYLVGPILFLSEGVFCSNVESQIHATDELHE
jgi:hypothetical protein